MNRAALSAPSLSTAPDRNAGLLAISPIGRPSMRIKRGDHAEAEPAAQLEDAADVGERRRSPGARRRRAGGSPGRRGAAGAGRRTPMSAAMPWKYDRYCLVAATASASSCTAMSTTPLATCTSIGPISSGRNTPRLPPSISAGPPMPMFESAVAMITSQHPSSDALPAKQKREVTPTRGTRPDSRAIAANVGVSSGR